MNYLMTLKSLYALNGVVAVLLYVPQIISAWKDRSAFSLSLVTFGGWCVGSVITLLYAWCCVEDRMFSAVSMGNVIGSGSLFCIIAGRRIKPHPSR